MMLDTVTRRVASTIDSKSRRNLWRYCKTLRLYRSAWLIAIVCTLLTVGMKLPMPLLTGYLIDKVIIRGQAVRLNIIAGALVLLTITYLLVGYLGELIVMRIHQSITTRYRLALLEHIHRLPTLYVARKETGYLMSRILQDPAQLNGLVMQVLSIANSLITLMAGLVAMFVINWRLAAVSLTMAPFFAGSYLVFQGAIRRIDNQEKEQQALISKGLKESLSATAIARLFQLETRELHRFLRNLRQGVELAVRSFQYESLVSGAASFFASMGPLLVVWFGGHEVMRGRLTIGQLVAFSSLLGFVYAPTRSIVTSQVAFLRALVSLNRVSDILDEPPEVNMGSKEIPQGRTIEFCDVEFGYGNGESVLAGINAFVREGEAVGIVGPMGAGKSTLISLLPRLLSPTAGQTRLGGLDVARWPLRALRRQMSVMAQTPFLFAGTILENIWIANPNAELAEVVEAARRANAYSFIQTLEKGFDTQVGEDGQFLSGGQKQLIALARVILRNAPILILDEPTSAIDSTTEHLLQQSLLDFMRGRTSIVVSHRLSTLLNVDRIIVLEQGRITAEGSHWELLQNNEFYARAATIQSDLPALKEA